MKRISCWAICLAVAIGLSVVAYSPCRAAEGKAKEEKVKKEGKESKEGKEKKEGKEEKGVKEEAKPLEMKDLPKAVQDAIAKEAGKNEVKELLAKEGKEGNTYEAEWTADGKSVTITVTADGKIADRETEQTVEMKDLPKAVQDAIAKQAGKNKIETLELAESKEGKVYEASWTADGKTVEVQVSPDGEVLPSTNKEAAEGDVKKSGAKEKDDDSKGKEEKD